MKNTFIKGISFSFNKICVNLKLALIVVALFHGFNLVHAQNITQSDSRVTLSAKNQSLKQILDQITSKTKYTFFYKDEYTKDLRNLTIDFKNSSIEEVLKSLLKDTNLGYTIKNNQVFIQLNTKDQSVAASKSTTNVSLKGTVVDPENLPIIGANIYNKATNKGAISDFDGNFSLTDVPAGSEVVISYIGYSPKTIKAADKTFNIQLEDDKLLIDEVVVVGYGATTKRSLVSSVAQVNTENMGALPSTNITQSLAGTAPGLIVQSGSGLNSKASISIRGGGDPIYVIDGVIRSGNDFANLNSDDIEAISILKDASSTAVYGARAAYGIVQVTTKSGKQGKAQVNYSLTQTWGQPSFWAKRVNSHVNALKINEARTNEGLDPQYSDEALEKYRTGSDPGQYPNTDWRKEVLKNWAPATRHNLAVTGGGETNNYYTSLGYTDMNSLFKSGRYTVDRVNYNLSNTTNIKEIGLKVTAQLSGFIESSNDIYTSEGAGHGYVIQQVGMKRPNDIARNKYGLPYDVANNPVADSSQDAGYMKSKSIVANGLLNVEWSVPWVKGLTARATGNYNWYDANDKNWRKDAAKYSWDSTTPLYAAKPQLGRSDTQGSKWTLQYFLNYNRTFGIHEISALVGYEASSEKGKGMGLTRYNYSLPIDQINFGPTDDMDNSAWESEAGRAGYIAQVKYGLLNRYYIEGSFRRDGSDIFPKDNRWGNFFSVSLGWNISDEPFMNYLRDNNIVNLLKLRASYGEVGMDQGIDRFLYLDIYNYNASGYVFDGNMYPTLYEGGTPSVNLTWYKDKQYGVGFDFSSLKNRLYGMFDYYLFVTSGYMADPDPLSAGYIAPYGRGLPQIESNGEKRRAGMDFQLGYRDSWEDLTYDASFNITKYDIYWSNYPWETLDAKRNPYTRQTGQYEHFSQTGYHYLGTARSADEYMMYAQRPGSTNLTGGDFIYQDFNGDGRINGEDQYRIGRSTKPLINFGLNINLGYKGFSLSMLFQGAGKRDLHVDRTLWDYNYLSQYDYQLDYWREDNQGGKFPRILSSQSVNGNNNLMGSEAWTINGTYFRMKNLVFSYDFKYKLLKNTSWLTTCRLALTGQNLFTISKATKFGIDPEIGNSLSSYPIERVIGVNLNIGF